MVLSCFHVCALVGVLLFTGLRLDAQVLYGSIVGQANDPSGAAIPAAAVTATNKATGQQRQTATNDAGQYTFAAVQPGTYEVRITKDGFRPVIDASVEVTANNVTRIDQTLPVGAVSEAVTVEAASAALQTDSSSVKAEVTSRELQNVTMPVGRNYQNMLVTIPGFSPPRNVHSVPTNPSRALEANVNGAPRSGVNVRIDGASSQQTWLPHIAAYVPALEAIDTVNVVTNSFSAEQGLAGGASINVQIKGGSNDFHGVAFWYHNNNAMIAKPYTFALLNQQNQRNPKYIFNQPGGTFGGPIIKNKLFFFGSYEGSFRREFANNTGTLATAAMRRGDFSDFATAIGGGRGVIYDLTTGNATGQNRTPFAGNVIPDSRISPISKRILEKVPLPNAASSVYAPSNYFAQGGFLFDRNTIDSKFNYNVNEKWTMYARYSYLRYTMQNPGILGDAVGPVLSGSGGNVGTANGTTQSFTYSTTYLIKPNLILDAYYGYTTYGTAVEQPFLDQNIGLDVLKIPGTNGKRRFEGGWPRFTLAGFSTIGVPDSFMPYERRDPSYQYVGNLNWTKGRHQIRFGADLYRQDLNHMQAEFAGQAHGAQGGFNFTAGPTLLNGGPTGSDYNTYASFLLGQANNYGTTLQVPDVYNTRTWMFSAFAQDTWQVNQKLTVNLGIRYTNIPMPRRADRGMERYDFRNNKMWVCGVGVVPADCGTKNSNMLFSPSVGIAYRPDEKTVIRTGFGINWDPLNLIRALRTNYPLMIILNGAAPNAFTPAGTLEQGIPIATAPSLGNGIIDIPSNYALTSTGDEFERAYIMSWNFTVQRQLGWNTVLQAGYVANRTVKQTGFMNLNAMQQPGIGNPARPFFQSFGRTVQTSLVQPIGNTKYDSLQTQLTKRFADGVSVTFAYTFSKAIGICCNSNNDGGPAIQAINYYNLGRSLTDFDRTHNFQGTFIYELPFGRGKKYMTSGAASWILGGWQVSGLLSAYSGSPFSPGADGTALNMDGTAQRADLVGPVRKLGGVGRGQAYYDWLSFKPVTNAANVAEARLGTAGYQILRGPKIVNVDMGLFRRFNITERMNLQFRAEVLNVSNTMQLANPSSNISSLQLFPDGSFRGGVFEVTGTANTGRDGLVQRAVRLGLRFAF